MCWFEESKCQIPYAAHITQQYLNQFTPKHLGVDQITSVPVIPTVVSFLGQAGPLARRKPNWRSHKLGVSKASSAKPNCMPERSGGWHYSTTALQPEATAVPARENQKKIPWKIRLREKGDNARKLTLCVWSAVSLTSSWMSQDQVVETMLLSVTWSDVLKFSLFLPNFCPQLRAEKDLCSPL